MQIKYADLNSRSFKLPKLSKNRVEIFGLKLTEALRRKSIELEIGCGVGWHPIEIAKQMRSDQAFIAVERTSNKFAAFKRRLENHPSLKTVLTAVHGDAFHFIAEEIPDQALERIWLLYPNPEVKRPNNRWYRSPGFRRTLAALRIGGHFHFATNIAEYASTSESQAKLLGLRLQESQIVSQTTHTGYCPRTHFEKKYFERGERLFDYTFEKVNEVR